MYLSLKTHGQQCEDKYKASLFIHVIREDTREIYNAFTWTEEGDEWKLECILETFEEYCADRDSEAMLARRFFQCNQKVSQSIDSYFTEVQALAKKCNFAPITERMIKYRIMCGVDSQAMCERLFREKNYTTLAKVLQICRAAEAAKQAKELSKGLEAVSVEAVNQSKWNSQNSVTNKSRQSQSAQSVKKECS